MATLDSLQFEMERRVALYTWRTTMPDDTSLGYNADPNLIVSPSTDGETLLYNAPVSTRYTTLDSSSNVDQEYFKQAQPSVWLPLGSGSDASLSEIENRLDALDASIVIIDASIQRIDSSILNLYEITSVLESSIGRIDASLAGLFDISSSIEASILRIDSSITDLYDTKVDKSGDAMTGDLTVPGVDITNDLSVGSGATFGGNVDIAGDLRVDGSTIFVHTTELDVSTNFINLNTGLTGTPPSWLQSGIVVERGSEDPYIFVFDETDDTFRIGVVGSPDASGVYNDSSTQAVATREDSPVDNAIAIWNDVLNRFDTSTGLTFGEDGLYADGSLKVTSLSGSGIRFVVVNPDGTLDASTFSLDNVNNRLDSLDASITRIDASITNLYSVTDTLDGSITRIDASITDLYSRDVSVSIKNIGSGDVSIFYGVDSSAYAFRELKAKSSRITLDVSDNIILIDASVEGGSGGDGIDGGVWITDINPQGSGNVGDKVYSSDGNVLNSCLTDTSALTVSVLALPGHTNYKPIVTINDVSVSLSEGDNQPLWEGTYNIQYDFADASITVLHEDGAHWSTEVDADTPASVQVADFINGYPGSQTQLKAGDTFDVSIMTDVSITSVEVDNYGAATGGTYAVSGNNVGITITIADRGTSTQALGLRLRVVKSTGSTSANYLTENQGSVDGKDLVNLNNTYPSISFGTITYPVGQSAIKLGETGTVANTVTNYDTLTYSSPNSELGIASPTVYVNPKTVSYSSGGYNISTNNLRIVANRTANDATTTQNTVVWIANTPVTLSVSNPAARLRSGGNDGTAVQPHTITITSSQRLISAPTLQVDTGTTADWQTSATFGGGPTTWTNTLLVDDDDAKGEYDWGAISGTNLAGIQTTTNSGAAKYTLGGFVPRTITVQQQLLGKENPINVEVTTYSKLSTTGSGQTLAWSVKDLTTRSTLGDTTGGQAATWSASNTGTNPTTIYILDTNALTSSSQSSTFVIQESV